MAPRHGSMSVKTYLLPCECSGEVAITAADAGGTVACPRCGRRIDVPKLRNLGNLREASATAGPVRRRWTVGHTTVLVGVLLAGTAGLVSRLFQPPPPPSRVDLEDLRRKLAATPTANIYGLWATELRQRGIAPLPTREEEVYRGKASAAAVWRHRLEYAAAGALALAMTGALAVVLRSAAERSRGGQS